MLGPKKIARDTTEEEERKRHRHDVKHYIIFDHDREAAHLMPLHLHTYSWSVRHTQLIQ